MAEILDITQLKLTDVWKHEANDFTPWLASELGRLSETLGLNLELVDQVSGSCLAATTAGSSTFKGVIGEDVDMFLKLFPVDGVERLDLVFFFRGCEQAAKSDPEQERGVAGGWVAEVFHEIPGWLRSVAVGACIIREGRSRP